MVIDSGEDYYSVVFATNDEGTGYVEYEFGGDTVRLYDEAMGRIKGDSKIHTVKVPKEELDGNTYRVGSKRVVEAYSYGSYTGKEVVSQNYTLTRPTARINNGCACPTGILTWIKPTTRFRTRENTTA